MRQSKISSPHPRPLQAARRIIIGDSLAEEKLMVGLFLIVFYTKLRTGLFKTIEANGKTTTAKAIALSHSMT